MCDHRAVSRWHRFWRRLSTVYLIGFLVPEIYGLATVGPDATFSAFCWHSFGLVERCRHTRRGRLGIFVFCTWLWAHLSYGKFGLGGRWARRHVARRASC